MKKLLSLLALLLLLSGCSSPAEPAAEPAVRETPSADRTDFEVVGTVTQAEDSFLILELCLYEPSGKPQGNVAALAGVDAAALIPGYETRAILLDPGTEIWYRYGSELLSVGPGYLTAGQRVGVSAAGESMSILIYDSY